MNKQIIQFEYQSVNIGVLCVPECEQFGVRMTDSRLVAVVGGSGFGKSALLAKLAVIASSVGYSLL